MNESKLPFQKTIDEPARWQEELIPFLPCEVFQILIPSPDLLLEAWPRIARTAAASCRGASTLSDNDTL